MTVDPAAIRVVLDDSPDGKGKGVDPKRFHDNSFIQATAITRRSCFREK